MMSDLKFYGRRYRKTLAVFILMVIGLLGSYVAMMFYGVSSMEHATKLFIPLGFFFLQILAYLALQEIKDTYKDLKRRYRRYRDTKRDSGYAQNAKLQKPRVG